jgi:hypothetical protein
VTFEEFSNCKDEYDFDLTYKFAVAKIPEDQLEDDVLVCICERLFYQNKIADVLKIIDALKEHNYDYYMTCYAMFEFMRLSYFAFIRDEKEVENIFSVFIQNKTTSTELYYEVFDMLIAYQHNDLLNNIFNKKLLDIKDISEWGRVSEEFEFYSVLEQLYIEDSTCFHVEKCKDIITRIDYRDEYINSLTDGLFGEKLNGSDIRDLFCKDSSSAMFVLRGGFLRYMHSKNSSFSLSLKIWEEFENIWDKNIRERLKARAKEKYGENAWYDSDELEHDLETVKIEDYFDIDLNEFYESVENSQAGWFNQYFATARILWGGLHICEYLFELGFVSLATVAYFQQFIRELKGELIAKLIDKNLWQLSFVHSWQRPDCVSAEEFDGEKCIFEKSINIEGGQKFDEVYTGIQDELGKTGQLGEYIVKYAKNPRKRKKSYLDKLTEEFEAQQPVRVEKEPGRNEPCTCGSGKKYKKCCLNKK